MQSRFTIIFLVTFVITSFAQKVKQTTDYQKDMDKLAKQKSIVKAFQIIDELEPDTRRDHILLTEIPAPPFKEAERAKQYAKMLQEAGADKVWIDEEGNVIAERKGKKGGRTVGLDAHLDTVFPEETDVKVKIVGDTLKAPGIGDDTRGLAAVLTTLRALEKAGIETEADLLIVGTVGEEGLGDLRGMKYIFNNSDLKIDSWIAVDGRDIGRIVSGGLGSVRYKVTFEGPGGHSWGAFGLGNPHHAIGKAIDYFSEAAGQFTATGSKTSFNVGRMGGGTSVNSIPFESWMEVDMRSVDPERLRKIDSIFNTSMQRALIDYNKNIKRGPALTVNVEKIGSRPSGFQSDDLPLVQRAMAAAKLFVDDVATGPSSTNSNIPISKGVPAVTLGSGGDGSGAHALHEWWVNNKGADAIKFILLVTVAEAGLAK